MSGTELKKTQVQAQEEAAAHTDNQSDGSAMQELIRLTRENNEKQEKYRGTMVFMARCATIGVCVLVVCMLCAYFIYAPRLNSVITQLDSMLVQGNEVVANAKKVTDELAAIDIEETMKNVNTLVVQSQDGVAKSVQTLQDVSSSVLNIDYEGINKAIGEMSQIDFESLNGAIKDLQAVIEPLAKFFKK